MLKRLAFAVFYPEMVYFCRRWRLFARPSGMDRETKRTINERYIRRMDKSAKRVLVGMSGGIDSTATCLMLKEQGYEVVGLTMWVWGDEPAEARALADSMGLEHCVADEREPFRQVILKHFIDEYRAGRTPNPCVMCNPLFKFRLLTEWADKLGCTYIATGHYTRLEERNGKVYIVTGDDERKDQSYFLWRLGQDVLRRCVFPLGAYTKGQVRQYLRDKGYTLKAEEGESMEVCFVQGDYRDFLRQHSPEIDREVGAGWFVDSEGVKLGEHKGFPYYTVGQRKGLEIALGKPAYVLKINPRKNIVMLGDANQLKAEYMLTEQDNLTDEDEFFGSERLTVRIRYRGKPIPCRVKRLEDGRLLVHFLSEASAIAPGQSAVFYIGRRVVGGAFIASQRGIGMYVAENNHEA